MKLTKIGLLSISLITLIQADIIMSTTCNKIKKSTFVPKVEIRNNLITIIPEDGVQIEERTKNNPNGQNVSNYVLPKIKNGKLKMNTQTNIELCGEKTYVVAVGVNNYKYTNMKLQEAVNDAKNFVKKIATTCTNTQSHLLLDSRATTKRIISTITKINSKANKNDSVIFFYSGNGFNYKKENYIVSYDSKLKKDKPLINTFISVKKITFMFKANNIKKGLMIFDACTSKIDSYR